MQTALRGDFVFNDDLPAKAQIGFAGGVEASDLLGKRHIETRITHKYPSILQ